MAKFAVGDKAVIVRDDKKYGRFWQGTIVEIVGISSLRGKPNICTCEEFPLNPAGMKEWCFGDDELRKLPGDSTSLPSWLTNMLKVPQGDPDKVKQPEKVK